MLNRMAKRHDGIYSTHKIEFASINTLKKETITKCINFAYEMTCGQDGAHRNHRSGGNHRRKQGEIFANTFQGKISECAAYNILYKYFPEIAQPDFQTYGLGRWDETDFEVANQKISIKSTKSFGQLLLLECKDWNNEGIYLPNQGTENEYYDYFILIRIKPFCENILKTHKLLYTNELKYSQMLSLLQAEHWQYDCPGFTTDVHLRYAINNQYIINQGEMLNGTTEMDADNYYIQAGDLLDIAKIETMIKSKN